jgi:hypothetical protein
MCQHWLSFASINVLLRWPAKRLWPLPTMCTESCINVTISQHVTAIDSLPLTSRRLTCSAAFWKKQHHSDSSG